MKIRFKNVVSIYLIFCIIASVSVCANVWMRLEDFQEDYEKGTIAADNSDRLAPEYITFSPEDDKDSTPDYDGVEITAYSNMQVYAGGVSARYYEKEQVEDQLLYDYSEYTGNEVKKVVYVVDAESIDDITVKNNKGIEITPQDNDYTLYSDSDDGISQTVLGMFELYLKHVSRMVDLSELESVMDTSGKAYKAVKNSQKSLEWMIKAESMEFSNEKVSNIQYLDDNNVICDVYAELKKVTENKRTVNETVHYGLFCTKKSGKWYIYSFDVK